MINVTNITKAIESIFKEDPISDKFKGIERGNVPNIDAGHTPWLGIYRRRVDYDPHTIGGARSWKGNVEIGLLVQASSFDSGGTTEDILENLLKDVHAVLLKNKKLKGTVDRLVGMAVEYFFNDNNDTSFAYQQAEIILTYEVRTE